MLPLSLLLLASLATGIVAYGVDARWARYPQGLEVILLSRRLEGPLLGLAIILCLGLIVWIISGQKRAWWVVGLAPILALLAHRFVLDPNNALAVNGHPQFVGAEQASFVADDDWVVGIIEDGGAVAYPYGSLYAEPLVVQSAQEKPLLLMWSPFANCAVAVRIDWSIKARDLELVSMPANALLVYNTRLGQFINGVTGRMMDGRKPVGFEDVVPTIKTTWRQWRTAHPRTQVLMPPVQGKRAPTRPLLPYYPMPRRPTDVSVSAMVALIGTAPAVAVLEGEIEEAPVNLRQPLEVLVRDPATEAVRGFERKVDEDLFPMFAARTFAGHPEATMIDSDSGSAWTAQGVAVDGPLKGKRLKPLAVNDGVYYSVMRFWYPELEIVTPLPPPLVEVKGENPPEIRHGHRRWK